MRPPPPPPHTHTHVGKGVLLRGASSLNRHMHRRSEEAEHPTHTSISTQHTHTLAKGFSSGAACAGEAPAGTEALRVDQMYTQPSSEPQVMNSACAGRGICFCKGWLEGAVGI